MQATHLNILHSVEKNTTNFFFKVQKNATKINAMYTVYFIFPFWTSS